MLGSATTPDWLQTLSPRKREIVELICQGMGRKEIAACMAVSPETIKQYTRDIYQRAGVHSAKELLAQILGCHSLGWAAGWLSDRAASPRECHLALVQGTRELAPEARVRLVAGAEMPPPARAAVAQGQRWNGKIFYAPYWAPPQYAAIAVHADPPVGAELAAQVHVLAALAQGRLTWLAQRQPGPAAPLAPLLLPPAAQHADLQREFAIFAGAGLAPLAPTRLLAAPEPDAVAPEWAGDDGF